MSITVEDVVRREVGPCVSALVSTIAEGTHFMPPRTRDYPIAELCERASRLCSPVLDYEEAARQAGWKTSDSGQTFVNETEIDPETKQCAASEASPQDACGWQNLCDEFLIDPYEWEIFEHWVVSPWLADKLEAEGERIEKDFAGLCVWGRTCSGQGIASDGVIHKIHADLIAP